jgi:N-acetyl-anhydromuramyl-L-alanine amidase AmpD
MKRIIIHWTAGNYKPSNLELLSYHYLIDNLGKVHNCVHKPEDNEDCHDGNYAAHCGGGNTGSIGVAMCGMFGYKNFQDVGKYPLTKIQCEKMFSFVAELCKKYNIPITPDTVMTHYEFGRKHINTTSFGKIDIVYLPPYPEQPKETVGNFIRGKVKWYYEKLI